MFKIKKINNHIDTQCFVYEDLFSEEECDIILKGIKENYELKESELTDGVIEPIVYHEIRKSKVISLSGKFDYEKKIKERLLDFIKFINKEYYKFDIDRTIDEEITLVEYGEGNHINWHSDIGLGELSRRKLSCVIQLNNSEEYDEGNLQFFNKSTDVEKMRKKGAGIIFPSFLQHRVTEITKGQRNVLVCFMHGQPFK